MIFSLQTISAQKLDQFYASFSGPWKTFLQISKYGGFRESIGEKNFRIGIFQEKKLIGVAQFQKINAKRGSYLHTPHGPLIYESYIDEATPAFLAYYKKLGEQEKCDFVRVSPPFSPYTIGLFSSQKFRPAPIHLVNPELSLVLDITKSEATLLKNMRKSTRYEVQRVKRCHIEVKKGNSVKDLDTFWGLHEKTVKRQSFIPFSKDVTATELKVFGNDVQIFSAYKDGNAGASSVILFDSHAGYYHQGASEKSSCPFSYATLWAAILEAKKRGCREFNFWGVSEKNAKKHPWYGLSQFKRGFGGEERRFLHVQDHPLTMKYWLNFGVECYRKWSRNY